MEGVHIIRRHTCLRRVDHSAALTASQPCETTENFPETEKHEYRAEKCDGECDADGDSNGIRRA